MEDSMEILHIKKKGSMINTLERFYIYNVTKIDNQINDKGTAKQNILFDTIIWRSSSRGHPTQHPSVRDTDLVQL